MTSIRSGNKGEWSEVYALFRLLERGKLAVRSKSSPFEVTSNSVVKEVSRGIGVERISFKILQDEVQIFDSEMNFLKEVPRASFANQADILLMSIKKGKSSFEISEIERFLASCAIEKIKAPSKMKSDIEVAFVQEWTNAISIQGFSIKSFLGSSPTLLNASKSTNITFGLEKDGRPFSDLARARAQSGGIREQLRALRAAGITSRLKSLDNRTFRGNLQLVDSSLPEIYSEAVHEYYLHTDEAKVNVILPSLAARNPLNFEHDDLGKYFVSRFENLLMACALGMQPARPWDGKYEAVGGYLVIGKKGDVSAIPFENVNAFKEYLYSNSKFDQPSTSKHGYGDFYQNDDNDDQVKFKLNSQIRFSG